MGKYIRGFKKNYVVVDLETTGLSPQSDSIIEIGALKVIDGHIVDEFSVLIDPHKYISSTITRITGITNEMVIGKPSIEDVFDDFLIFIEDYPILGHNVRFDLNFLQAISPIHNDWIDTLHLSRSIIKELKHHRLSDLVAYFQVSLNTHRAIDDCVSTKEVYDFLEIEAKNRKIKI